MATSEEWKIPVGMEKEHLYTLPLRNDFILVVFNECNYLCNFKKSFLVKM